MYRALTTVFYCTMHPAAAIKLASNWLEAMNDHENACDISKFDDPKQTDIFKLLGPVDASRPEMHYIRFICSMFDALNEPFLSVMADNLVERVPLSEVRPSTPAHEHSWRSRAWTPRAHERRRRPHASTSAAPKHP